MDLEKVALWKDLMTSMVDTFPGGVVFAASDRETLTWKIASQVFDVPAFKVGLKVRVGGAAHQCMQTGEPAQEEVAREVYGIRIIMYASPVFEGDQVVGSTIIGLPRLHPVARSFKDFAPMMADIFPEGAFLYITDLTKYAYRQDSKKFDIPTIQIGDSFAENKLVSEAIRTKNPASMEIDASVHGVPIMVMTYPLFDEDNASMVVGTFGIIQPRQTQVQLREIAGNLERGLSEMAAVIEELASSASEISNNEQHLNQNVQEVLDLSEDINDVLVFIKLIADETKMLGLNAAIEAARAGEAGRGFGVVAEEIRKLSDESRETVTKIRDLTERIKEKIVETNGKSELNLRASEEQAAATEEITASIEEIAALAQQMEKIAQDM